MNQRNPRSITRLRILDEAHTMLLADGMPEAIGVRLADVLSRLGLTTGAAYNIWDSQTHFREDLILHMASHQRAPELDEGSDLLATIEEDGLDEVAAASALLTKCIRRAEGAPDHRLTYYLATIREPSPELADAVGVAQQHSLTHTKSVVRVWMDHFEREPAAPHTTETLAVLARNAIEGIVLRQRYQPEVTDLDGEALAVRGLAAALVEMTEPRS